MVTAGRSFYLTAVRPLGPTLMTAVRLSLALVVPLVAALPVRAQQPPSYARHVRPFLAKYCVECHNSKSAKAGLDLETYQALRKGSDGGEILNPGNPDDSALVLLTE